MQALKKIGGTCVVKSLMEAVNDKVFSVRWFAIEALGEIGSQKAIPVLAKHLADKDYTIRRSAAEAIGRIGGQEAFNVLSESLRDKNSETREAAVWGISKLATHEPEKAIELLSGMIADASLNVKRAAVQALAGFRNRKALEVIIEKLKTEDQNTKKIIFEVLEELSGKKFGLEYEIWRKWLEENQ